MTSVLLWQHMIALCSDIFYMQDHEAALWVFGKGFSWIIDSSNVQVPDHSWPSLEAPWVSCVGADVEFVQNMGRVEWSLFKGLTIPSLIFVKFFVGVELGHGERLLSWLVSDPDDLKLTLKQSTLNGVELNQANSDHTTWGSSVRRLTLLWRNCS